MTLRLDTIQGVVRFAIPTLTTQEGRAIISGIAVIWQKTAKWAELLEMSVKIV